MHKICPKCNEEKEVEKFVIVKGVCRNFCKECRNKSRRVTIFKKKGVFKSRGKGGRFDCWFRKQIKERDGNKCTRCGNVENLHAHHIVRWKDSEELRFEPTNLITLCDICHAIVEPKFPKNPIPWNKGKSGVYSEETKALWSSQRKGKQSWNKGLEGYRAGTKRKPHTEESRKKMSEKLKGKPWTESRRLAQKK